MTAPGVTIEATWRAMGMRGTGSHDVVLSNVFVSDTAIVLRREAGKWHFIFHLISMLANPLVYSAYMGVAEAMRDRTIQLVKKRSSDEHLCYMVGGLDNELTAARLALQHMISTSWMISGRFQDSVLNNLITETQKFIQVPLHKYLIL